MKTIDGKEFSEQMLNTDWEDSPDNYKKLYGLFNSEMQKAVREGRICTPERMAVLYPIFREINDETDANIRDEQEFERSAA